jgi:tetratricopeptide (TPR) repeat protein
MRSDKNRAGLFVRYFITPLLLVFFVSTLKANENTIAFDSANTAYSKGNFDKAIKLYESITNKNVEAAGLYFNLGNAYYKTNNIGHAILNYEKAKKLSPNDEDINTNLKLAYQKTEDKIDAAPGIFLIDWKNGIVNLMSEKEWSLFCIILVALSFTLIAVYIVSQSNTLQKMGFFGGVILAILTIAVFFIAQQKYETTKNSTDAIITTSSVTVTGSPNEKGTKLFILHEGTKVSITDENADWTEIKIANGNVGWIKTDMLSTI